MSSDKEEFRDILETNRFEIVQRLQTDRTFLFDYLRSKSVFDSGDYDLVLAEKTREQKAGKFLDILVTKGRTAYDHFIDALQLLNPGLFEKLTGQKSTSRPNPIMMGMKENFPLGDGTRTLDLDILSNHLKRTIQDLQDMTLRYDQVLKNKQELTKDLQETRYDLQGKNNRVELLERQIQEGEAKILEVHTNAQRAQDAFTHQISAERERINENNTFIIALQMRLLDYKEQIDSLEKQKNELSSQNDTLKGKLHEIYANYENERRQSMKLSERLETQKSDIERVQETKRKNRELVFQNQQLLNERDEITEELDQLKKWTEALKARYDILKQEKDETLESHESVVADCSSLRDQSYRLELTISQAKRREDDLAKLNKDLEEAVKSYKKQRDLCEQSMKEAIIERDQARNERDECQGRYKEVVNSRDAKINKHMEETKKFEGLYEEARKEMKNLKERLQEAENAKQMLLERVISIQSADQPRPNPAMSTPNQDTEDGTQEAPVSSPRDSTANGVETYNWKQRKTKDVICSLKKRIQPGCNTTNYRAHSSLESDCSSLSYERETSLDEKLAAIIPQFDSLSPEAKQSLSLQRDLPVKMLLPFDTIATMCPSLTLGSTSAYDTNNRMSTQSPLTEFMSTRRSERCMRRPLGCRSCDSSQESDATDGVFGVASDTLEPEILVRPPYSKSLSSPSASIFKFKSPNENRDSGRASSIASDSDQSLATSDKNTNSEAEEDLTETPEAEQLPAAGTTREHKKLSKAEPEQTPFVVKGHKRDSYKEGNDAFNALNSSECKSFDFGNVPITLQRVESICNESEESQREVQAALQSPGLSSPFRERATRLSQEERPRSKSTN